MRVLANSLRAILRPRLVQTAVARPVFKAPAIRHLSATLPRRVDDEWSILRVQTLRLGSEAPNFRAQTTHGKIDFHKFRPPLSTPPYFTSWGTIADKETDLSVTAG